MKALIVDVFTFLMLVVFGAQAFAADFKKLPPENEKFVNAIKRLVAEQKYQAAEKVAAEHLKKNKGKNEIEYARALIQKMQLQLGLHGYETAVKELRAATWPKDPMANAMVTLQYAQSMILYFNAYQWEINKREEVISSGKVDLKLWTKDQIDLEINTSIHKVWKHREELGKFSAKDMGEVLNVGSYPKSVRPTLRDSLTYLFAQHLANTSFWSPEELNSVYYMNLTKLLSRPQKLTEKQFISPSVHPYRKIAFLLEDLKLWHQSHSRSAAALEAQLKRANLLKVKFSNRSSQAKLTQFYLDLVKNTPDNNWKPKAYYDLASHLAALPDADAKIRGLKFAKECVAKFRKKKSVEYCKHLKALIVAPSFQVRSMLVDVEGKPSVEIRYANLTKLYARAYETNFKSKRQSGRSSNLLNTVEDYKTLLGTKPFKEWVLDLKATKDHREHKAYRSPELSKNGAYVILYSAKPDFKDLNGNKVLGINFVQSRLLLLKQQTALGDLRVRAVDGETGKPKSSVNVDMYQQNYNGGHTFIESFVTDKDGWTSISIPKRRNKSYGYFLYAEHEGQVTIDTERLQRGWRPPQPSGEVHNFVYTDRSIYRPGQKIFVKGLSVYGTPTKGEFSAKSRQGQKIKFQLFDANYKEVMSIEKTAGKFGSASTEFVIPRGRTLGNWSVTVTSGQRSVSTSIKVEEYKRPTFLVELKKPAKPLVLGKKATIKGSVKYYFGQPVTEGEVRYKITRKRRLPWWWGWCFWGYGGASQQNEIVAVGKGRLNMAGDVLVSFVPKVAKAEDNPSLVFDYTVSVDVTDIGGETRSASKAYSVGRVAVQAIVQQVDQFIEPKESIELGIVRSSLNGLPLSGKGSWSLHKIRQPKETRSISEEPMGMPPGSNPEAQRYTHPDDRIRPRWTKMTDWRGVVFHWKEGAKLREGVSRHNKEGIATLNLKPLTPGFYRLKYMTKDVYGSEFKTSHDFFVVGKGLKFPLLVATDKSSYQPGETAKLFVYSGFPEQRLNYQISKSEKVLLDKEISADGRILQFKVTEAHRGGLALQVFGVNDFQMLSATRSIAVPWTNKVMSIEFSSFRDELRPGARETFVAKLSKSDGRTPLKEAAEVLAYMYDKSLDAFTPHSPPNLNTLFSRTTSVAYPVKSNLATDSGRALPRYSLYSLPSKPYFRPDSFRRYDSYGVGGLGRRRRRGFSGEAEVISLSNRTKRMKAQVDSFSSSDMFEAESTEEVAAPAVSSLEGEAPRESSPEEQVRQNFSETAFWIPQLKANKKGEVKITFQVPDSVTEWSLWLHAFTNSLASGQKMMTTKSVKELMVRPYLPRFFREADKAKLRFVINNTSKRKMNVTLKAEIFDPKTNKSLLKQFGVKAKAWSKKVAVPAGGSESVSMALSIPSLIGDVAVKVTGSDGKWSDGEQKVVPILPSRMHLLQSRFVTLKKNKPRTVEFKDMNSGGDKSLIHKQLVLTLDAQLFYSVLSALPYLVNYPYQCTEQTLNRFISTAILTQIFEKYPTVKAMAKKMAKKRGNSRYEKWKKEDPNRLLYLEESPWLNQSAGGKELEYELAKVLSPEVARSTQSSAMSRLRNSQASSGGFPWFPGGRPSPYITLLVVHGFAKAAEFGVKLDKAMIVKSWNFLADFYRSEKMTKHSLEFLVLMNYLASAFPDESWMGSYFDARERQRVLAFTFKKWKDLSPYLKAYLALTLHRAKRTVDAKLVFDSIMDSAKFSEDQGTYWAAEDRSWLWYNDTVEGHAYALRAMSELNPKDGRREGLVQWLFLNKKLGHWKSTRATAEVLYSLVHYLEQEKQLGQAEAIEYTVAGKTTKVTFSPDEYTGKSRQSVFTGAQFDPKTMSKITFKKTDANLGFASATWHFSTEELPKAGSGDFLQVERKYFLRRAVGKKMTLVPIVDGSVLSVGDEVEVQLGVRAKHQFEYVHLRDPRASGLEPGVVTSGWESRGGLAVYKEIRDSATNFFIEWLPQGQYTLKYRVRVANSGKFRVGPARLQSMYAPEFGAYSAGHRLQVK